ncbi:hypothetical protein PVAP13_9KG095470 [Panicum virgatum]|uniref:Uncharacterized protein n=1 Tax=Panicum virgatum TaxID=38727 RepID=A0A8T0NCF6_PANVG|nr:hypothetical protein PVAP13_9KG095470 [Panicum virgatum]
MLDALLGRDKLTGKQAAQPSRRLACPQLDGPRCPHRPPLFDRAASTRGTPACIGPAHHSAGYHSPASVCGSLASPPPGPRQLLLAVRAASPLFAIVAVLPCLRSPLHGLCSASPAWPPPHLHQLPLAGHAVSHGHTPPSPVVATTAERLLRLQQPPCAPPPLLSSTHRQGFRDSRCSDPRDEGRREEARQLEKKTRGGPGRRHMVEEEDVCAAGFLSSTPFLRSNNVWIIPGS